MPMFKVWNPSEPSVKARLISAERESQVGKHLLKAFVIERATPEDSHELGTQGVKLEQAAAE